MYHPTVIAHHLDALESSSGVPFKRYEPSQVAAIVPHLQNLSHKGKLRRPLRREEADFIRNERLLSKFDFKYWCERYPSIDRDGSAGAGVGVIRLWEAQTILLSRIAHAELEAHEMASRGEPTDGIRLVDHKARQLGGTSFARLLTMHRTTLWTDIRAIAASTDEPAILKVYNKDKGIYDSLPWWMRPSLDPVAGSFDVKGQHIQFATLNSFILYQHALMKSGLGQGSQFDVSHLTECASWPAPHIMIEHHFFPAIPQSPWTLSILESTAQGRMGWWPSFTERVRRGREPGWIYAFVPWYAEPRKYRRQPPASWTPSDLSLMHARKIYETSHEFMGRTVTLSREQLYWYETERTAAQERGSLNLFLTNYAADPMESFQHSNRSYFSTELLEKLHLMTVEGMAYDVTVGPQEVRQ